MSGLPVRFALLIAVALLALAPGAAFADRRDRIIEDCADDGRLQGRYTKSELRDARRNLPSDVAEYTDCEDVLRQAELPDRDAGAASAGGGGGPGALSAPTEGGLDGAGLIAPSTDDDRRALSQAASSGGQPITVGDQRITPGAAGLAPDLARNDVPAPLLAVLILLALGAVLLAVHAARHGGLRGLAGTVRRLRRT